MFFYSKVFQHILIIQSHTIKIYLQIRCLVKSSISRKKFIVLTTFRYIIIVLKLDVIKQF